MRTPPCRLLAAFRLYNYLLVAIFLRVDVKLLRLCLGYIQGSDNAFVVMIGRSIDINIVDLSRRIAKLTTRRELWLAATLMHARRLRHSFAIIVPTDVFTGVPTMRSPVIIRKYVIIYAWRYHSGTRTKLGDYFGSLGNRAFVPFTKMPVTIC